MTKTSSDLGFILTGAPGAGKTSIALGLENIGERIVPEAAIDFIRYSQARGISEPWLLSESQEMITGLQLQRESQMQTGQKYFLDRCVIDGACFIKYRSFSQTEKAFELIAKANLNSYNKKVFLIQTVSDSKNRIGAIESAEAIENGLQSIYTRLGFDVVLIPFAPLLDRVALVKKLSDQSSPLNNIEQARNHLIRRDYLDW